MKNRGLATSDEETKKRVAREGESAPHNERGLESADEENREKGRVKVEKYLMAVAEKVNLKEENLNSR
ncbi:MAG: hypothetical protein ACRD8K_04180 [Nitrososphaeraceae archaeon]